MQTSSNVTATPSIFLQVCFACVEEGEFKLAQLCGLNIIVNADDLDEVSEFYQRRGHFEQLMSLMESGLVSDAAQSATAASIVLLCQTNK